jgi:thioredoxin
MENLTLESFKEKIMDFETFKEDWKFQGKLPAILDFFAEWCSPCKTISPILEELSKEYEGKIDVYKIDTEEEQELSMMFGIKNLPSVLFIPMEGEPQMTVGALSKKKFIEIIEEVLIS